MRLEPGTTKNQAGRVFPFTDALAKLVDELWAEAEARKKREGKIPLHVFTRSGRRIKSFRKAWSDA